MCGNNDMTLARACKGKTGFILVLLAVEALIAMSPLQSSVWFCTHDGALHLDRLFAVTHEMRSGDFYPRWLSTACFGKGLPIFNYYSPAFYLIAGWLHLLGIPLVTVLKVITFAIFFSGSWGMYLWVKKSCNESGALIAATIYMFLPYHFLNLYVRGAFPEFMALALLPYLFHAIDISLSSKENINGPLLAAVITAAIILTHNLSALMIAPFALLMFGWRACTWKAPLRTIVTTAVGPVLGAGLSAFYWLPVIAETHYLDRFKVTLTSGYLFYEKHFVNPSQWFSSFWGFGLSGMGPENGMSFQLGYALLAVSIIAALSFLSASTNRNFGAITLSLGLLGLFFTTALSSIFYELIPWYQYVQFPWRFLGVSTLFFAAFTGLSTSSGLAKRFSWIPKVLLGTVILLCLVFSMKQRDVPQKTTEDLNRLEKTKIEEKTIGRLGSRNEFRPMWVPSYAPEDARFSPVISIDTSTQLSDVAIKGTMMFFRAAKTDDAPIMISWYYFPGWQVEVDGVREKVTPVPRGRYRGFVSVPVPAGTHTVRLWFGSTWPRILGWLIACITIITIVVLARLKSAKDKII